MSLRVYKYISHPPTTRYLFKCNRDFQFMHLCAFRPHRIPEWASCWRLPGGCAGLVWSQLTVLGVCLSGRWMNGGPTNGWRRKLHSVHRSIDVMLTTAFSGNLQFSQAQFINLGITYGHVQETHSKRPLHGYHTAHTTTPSFIHVLVLLIVWSFKIQYRSWMAWSTTHYEKVRGECPLVEVF